MKIQLCEICGDKKAILLCDGCGCMLCADCERFEIWGNDPEAAETKHFCPACYVDPEVNPWGASDLEAGLDELCRCAIQATEDDRRIVVAL